MLAAGLLLCQADCGNNSSTTPDMQTPTSVQPALSTISPASLPNGGGALTITGSGFDAGATVTIGGAPCVTTAVTATSITCTAPARVAMCGKQTIVVTNPSQKSATNSTLLTYTSAGIGFATKADYTVGTGPNMVAIGDFNGDTKIDLVVTNRMTGSVSLLTGKGDGTFNAATSPITGLSTPVGIDVADFNGDGKLDVVVAQNGGTSFSVHTGKGDGTFNTAITQSITGLTSVHQARFIDVNGDGALDVVAVANGSATTSLAVRLNDKAGGFTGTQPAAINIGFNLTFVSAADLNGDGKIDLALSSPNGNQVAIRTGDGTGAFSGSTNLTGVANAAQNVIVDLDGDGKLDIAANSQTDGKVYVWKGMGNATFGAATSYVAGGNPIGLAAVDLNGDGKIDLVTGNTTSTNVTVLLGSQGAFTAGTANAFATQNGVFGIAVADFNGDGMLDVVSANSATGFLTGTTVSVLLQQCK